MNKIFTMNRNYKIIYHNENTRHIITNSLTRIYNTLSVAFSSSSKDLLFLKLTLRMLVLQNQRQINWINLYLLAKKMTLLKTSPTSTQSSYLSLQPWGTSRNLSRQQ